MPPQGRQEGEVGESAFGADRFVTAIIVGSIHSGGDVVGEEEEGEQEGREEEQPGPQARRPVVRHVICDVCSRKPGTRCARFSRPAPNRVQETPACQKILRKIQDTQECYMYRWSTLAKQWSFALSAFSQLTGAMAQCGKLLKLRSPCLNSRRHVRSVRRHAPVLCTCKKIQSIVNSS